MRVFSSRADFRGLRRTFWCAIKSQKSKALQFGLFSVETVSIPFVSTVCVLGVPFLKNGVAPLAWEGIFDQARSQVELASVFQLYFNDKALFYKEFYMHEAVVCS